MKLDNLPSSIGWRTVDAMLWIQGFLCLEYVGSAHGFIVRVIVTKKRYSDERVRMMVFLVVTPLPPCVIEVICGLLMYLGNL